MHAMLPQMAGRTDFLADELLEGVLRFLTTLERFRIGRASKQLYTVSKQRGGWEDADLTSCADRVTDWVADRLLLAGGGTAYRGLGSQSLTLRSQTLGAAPLGLRSIATLA